MRPIRVAMGLALIASFALPDTAAWADESVKGGPTATTAEAKSNQEEASQTVSGRVVTREHIPIEHARVEAGGHVAYTDAHGQFRLQWDASSEIVVSHPRFEPFQARPAPGALLEAMLVPKQGVYEEIVVSAEREGDTIAPQSGASTSAGPAERAAPPTTVTDIVQGTPGVAENGQGGLFQNVSVRGVAGQRLLALLSGVPVITERRAGSSLSFVDPRLLGSVEVLRGPASTTYGSGALGGLIQALPRFFEGWDLEAGVESQGLRSYEVAGWGDDAFSFGIAHHAAQDSEAPGGEARNDHFSQLSAVLQGHTKVGSSTIDFLAIPSYGTDIGKDSADFPSRATTYPAERHMLARFGVSGEGYRIHAFVHPNELETEVRKADGSGSVVDNRAFDFGLDGRLERDLRQDLTAAFGLDYGARRGVKAREERRDRSGAREKLETLNGDQDDAAFYATLRYGPGAATILAGARATWQRQHNAADPTKEAVAPNAFVGLVWPFRQGFEIAANAGTGLRFPSLTERYFSGTTGRGGVIGNPDLDPERSQSLDLGVRAFGRKAYVEAYVYGNDVRDYIEQVDVGDGVSTFTNLTSGRIIGAEVAGLYEASALFQTTWSAMWQRGRSSDSEPLADVPSARATFGFRLSPGRFILKADVQHRHEKHDPGPGEKEIDGANLLSLYAGYAFSGRLLVSLHGSNLLDERYSRSADEKAPVATGHSFGIDVSYRP